jgi:starvation-inducible DNA-binding protein
LACQRPAFPRLPPAAGRAIGADFRHHVGGTTLRSIGHISKLQNIKDNDDQYVPAHEMLRELMNDNKMVAASMRECHELAEKHEDAVTAGLLENFIDATERRTWFLFEATRPAQASAR